MLHGTGRIEHVSFLKIRGGIHGGIHGSAEDTPVYCMPVLSLQRQAYISKRQFWKCFEILLTLLKYFMNQLVKLRGEKRKHFWGSWRQEALACGFLSAELNWVVCWSTDNPSHNLWAFALAELTGLFGKLKICHADQCLLEPAQCLLWLIKHVGFLKK